MVSDEACRSPLRQVGLQSGKSVSDQAKGSPMRHVVLQLGMSVSDEACQSPIRHAGLRLFSDWSPIGLRLVSDWSPIGLRSGILVFDWSLIRHVGLRWATDRSLIVHR